MKTFDDAGHYRIEIPSVEGPAALRSVLAAATQLGVHVNRVSQGSGIFMLTNAELHEYAELGTQHDIEVCLFVGPRASWGIGAQSRASGGASLGPTLRGPIEFEAGIRDVVRAVEAGIRSILVADIGLLATLAKQRSAGDLPPDLVFKVSAALPVANAATAQVLAELGGDTLNLPSDLDLTALASIRAAVSNPLDLYIESPDDLGGIVRLHEVVDIVTVASPIHLKFAVRNAPALYPMGAHLNTTMHALMAERVRRAALAVERLRTDAPHLQQSMRSTYP